jgi:hypothetical protein
MNFKKVEEILTRYEDKIDDLENWFNEFSSSLETYEQENPDDPFGPVKTIYCKSKDEIITELTNVGLSLIDAQELESALNMSNDFRKVDGTNDDIEKFTKDLLDPFEEMSKDLFKDEPEKKKSDLE